MDMEELQKACETLEEAWNKALCAEYPIEFNVCYEPLPNAFIIKFRNLETNKAMSRHISTSEIELVSSDLIIQNIIDQVRKSLIDCKEEK